MKSVVTINTPFACLAVALLAACLAVFQEDEAPKTLKAEKFSLVHKGVERAALTMRDRGADSIGPALVLYGPDGREVVSLQLVGKKQTPELVMYDEDGSTSVLLGYASGEWSMAPALYFLDDDVGKAWFSGTGMVVK